MDSILALRSAAPGSNLGVPKTFDVAEINDSALLIEWQKLNSRLHSSSTCKWEASTTKKTFLIRI